MTTTREPTRVAGIDYLFLVVGDRCWGRGKTRAAALKVARKEGGTAGLKHHNLYLAPPSARVDEMGSINWKEEEGKPNHLILLETVRGGLVIDPT